MPDAFWSRAGARGDDAVDDQLAALRALHAVTKMVHASLDLSATLDAVAAGVVEAAGFAVAVVNLRRGDVFEVVSVAGDERARAQLLGSRDSPQRWSSLLEHSALLGGLHFLDHRRTDVLVGDVLTWVPDTEVSDDEDAWHPLDALFARLTSPAGEWIGVLSVDLPQGGRRPGAVQLEVLELLADQAAIAITHARLHDALQEQEAEARYAARHDPLTGLANRALLAEAAEQLTQVPGGEVAALLIDLDGFKLVNDVHGHQAGDRLLRTVADRLRQCVRSVDVVARTGGDEFVVVVGGPHAGVAAELLVRRVREALARPTRVQDGSPLVGASIGVTALPTPVSLAELLGQADAAMYEDKEVRRVRSPG